MTSVLSNWGTSSCSRSCQCSTRMVWLWATTDVHWLQWIWTDSGQCLVISITLRYMPPRPWSSKPLIRDVSPSSVMFMDTHEIVTCSCMAVKIVMTRFGCVNESSRTCSTSDVTCSISTHVTSPFRNPRRPLLEWSSGNDSHWSIHSLWKVHSKVQAVGSIRTVISTLPCSERWASNSAWP